MAPGNNGELEADVLCEGSAIRPTAGVDVASAGDKNGLLPASLIGVNGNVERSPSKPERGVSSGRAVPC